jgi:predicted enzyme related to lactoylglutathione lyase
MGIGAAMAADAPHAVGIAGSSINVTDMDAEVKFYTEVVGLKVANTMKLPNGSETLLSAADQQGGPILALAQVDNMQPKAGKESYGRVILRVSDNEAMAKNIVAAGGSIHSTVDLPNGMKIIFAQDPEGFMIELLQAGTGGH